MCSPSSETRFLTAICCRKVTSGWCLRALSCERAWFWLWGRCSIVHVLECASRTLLTVGIDSCRLRSQLAEMESDHSETMSSVQAKHSTEIQTLKELLASSEAHSTDLQKEVWRLNAHALLI